MKVVCAIKKRDGSETPEMTKKEFINGKYTDYGVSEEEVKNMLMQAQKQFIEAVYSNIKVHL